MDENSAFFSPTAQKILKWIHLLLAACVCGGLLAICGLQIAKSGFQQPEQLFIFDFSAYHLFDIAVVYPFYGLLFTAVLYGVFTRWGFFRFRWITLKWILAIILFALVWFRVGPLINGMVALSDGGFKPAGFRQWYFATARQGIYEPLILLGFISLIFLVSVLKPWGLRRRQFTVRRKTVFIISGSLIFLSLLMAGFSYFSLQSFRNIQIQNIKPDHLSDGVYRGTADFGRFTYEVAVELADHDIKQIRIIHNRSSAYARYAEGVLPRVLDQQSPAVQAITGATTTSKALLKAVEAALNSASEKE